MTKEKTCAPAVWKFIALIVLINTLLVICIVRETTGGYQPIILAGNSMQHGNNSQSGIIDNGDSVIITKVNSKNEIMTYYEGKKEHYMKFGEYGDVAAFRANQSGGRLVHRLVCYARLNLSGPTAKADLPGIGVYGVSELVIPEYGFNKKDLVINFTVIYQKMLAQKNVVWEGYITKGDNFVAVDQETSFPLVSFSDIVGKVTDVIDNELSSRTPVYVLTASIVIFGSACLYVSWFALKNRKKKSLFTYFPAIVLALITGFVFVRDFLFIEHSTGISQATRFNYRLYAAFLALLTLTLIAISRWYLKKQRQQDNLIAPLVFLILFLPNYFIIWAGFYAFGYSLFALSLAASIYHLRPDSFFKNMTADEVNKKYGTWMIFFFCEIIRFMLILIVTLPFYFFFGAGWFAGMAYCAIKLKKSRPFETG